MFRNCVFFLEKILFEIKIIKINNSRYNCSRHTKAPCPDKFLIRAEDDIDGSIWEVVRDNKTGELLKNDGFPIYVGPKIFGDHEVKVEETS